MNFDWKKPLNIDWSCRSGPVIKEKDLKNSVISRILRNQYHSPSIEKKYIRVTPRWDPLDPYGNGNNNFKHNQFVPGMRNIPPYPQLSALTKFQHCQVLRVLSVKYKDVQPKNYPKPKKNDYDAYKELKELYEAEQKDYIEWAKLLWINGGCVRVLHPEPAVEEVYNAEFNMRMCEVQSMPQEYAWAAQIPLGMKNSDTFELEHKADLISVNVHDLPKLDYPEEMKKEFSILSKQCPVPEPCTEHPCKFVLPHKDSVSVLPLTEINQELAQYAIENGSTFIASENALCCLLDTDRNWKITVTVVEVICPESGDLKPVIVLGSEFSVQKECSMQRTYKAYKHLLQNTFVPSTGHYKSKTPTKQNQNTQKTLNPTFTKEPIAPRLNQFVSLDDDLEVSSKDHIDKHGHRDIDNDRESNDDSADECDSDRLLIDNNSEVSQKSIPDLDFYEHSNDAYDARPSSSHNEPNKEFDQLLVTDASKVNPDPLDFYKPNYSNDTNEGRLSYSHDQEPNGEPYSLFNDDAASKVSLPSFYEPNSKHTRQSYSHELTSPTRHLVTDARETNHESSDILDFYKPSYSYDKRSSSLDRELIADDNEPRVKFCEPSYSNESHKPNSFSLPHELMINDDETETNPERVQDSRNSNDTSDSSDNEADNVTSESSNNIDKLDTDKLCMKLFETNKDSSKTTVDASEKNDVVVKSFVETNKDTSDLNSKVVKVINLTEPSKTSDFVFTKPPIPVRRQSVIVRNTNFAKFIEPTYIIKTVSSESPKPVKNHIITEKIVKDNKPITCRNITKESPQLSSVKPCSESVEQNNIEPFLSKQSIIGTYTKVPEVIEPIIEKTNEAMLKRITRQSSISGTNTVDNVNGPSEVPIKSVVKPAGKLSISSTNNEVVKVIEPTKKTEETSLKPTRQSSIRGTNTVDNVNGPTKSTASEVPIKSVVKPARKLRISSTNNEVVKVIEPTKKTEETSLKLTRQSSISDTNTVDNVNGPTKRTTSEVPIKSVIKPAGKLSISSTNKEVFKVIEPTKKTEETSLKPTRQSSIRGTNTVDNVNGPTKRTTSEVPIKSVIKPAGKLSISSTNNEVVKVIEPTKKTEETSLKPTRQSSISDTNTVDNVNGPTKRTTSEVPIKSVIKPAGKLSISSTNNEVFKVIEPTKKTEETSLKPTRQSSLSGTNTVGNVNEPTKSTTSEVLIKSVVKPAGKLSISSSNNEVVKVIEPTKKTEETSLKPTRQSSISDTNTVDNVNGPTKSTTSEVPIKTVVKPAGKLSINSSNNEVDKVIEPTKKTEETSLKPTRKSSISGTNTVDNVNGPTKSTTSEVPIKSVVKPARKRSIRSINDEDVKANKLTKKTEETSLKPNTIKPSLCGTTEIGDVTKPVTDPVACLNKSPLKPCIKKASDSSPLKSARKLNLNTPTTETEQSNINTSCTINDSDSNEPSIQRIRKLTKQINQEHDYCIRRSQYQRSSGTRKVSARVGPTVSFDRSDYNQSKQNTGPVRIDDIASKPIKPGVTKLNFDAPFSVKTAKPSYSTSKPDITSIKPTTTSKSISRKIRLSQLFGDDSDSDDMIPCDLEIIGASRLKTVPSDNNPSNQVSQTIAESITKNVTRKSNDARKLSFTEPIRDNSSIKNPIKSGLRKSISESPRNSKRKLSFSDPSASHPDLNESGSEADSEEAFAGFDDGVPVTCSTLSKNPKTNQKNTATYTYGLRSRNKPKPTISKKSNTTKKKKNSDSLTKKVVSKTQCNTRNGAQIISCSDSDDDANQTNAINKKNKTDFVVLRRSRRLSTRVNAEAGDSPKKTNAKNNSENNEGLRRSPRVSVHTNKNMVPSTSNLTQNNDLPGTFSESDKNQNRRISLPANIFSKTNQINWITRSKSMTNLKGIAKPTNINQKPLSSRRSTRKNNSNILNLSERSKRYLRRKLISESESDQSDDELSERARRCINRSRSSCSGTEHSDTKINKRTKKNHSHSSSTDPYVIKTDNSKTGARTKNNENELSKRTKRYTRRSIASAYSSCDEKVQPNQVKRKKTTEGIYNTIVSSATKMDSSPAFTSINEKQPNQPKTDVTDFTECTNNEMEQKYEIKIELFEEINDTTKTMNVLHLTELNEMEESSSYTEDQINIGTTDQNALDTTNNMADISETKVENLNRINIRAIKMGTFNSDTESYDSCCDMFEANDLSRAVIDEAIDQAESNEMRTETHELRSDRELIQTEPDFVDRNATDTTSCNVIRSRNNSISDSSDSSDYFDMNDTESLNIFHFTATTADSEEESEVEDILNVSDSQPKTVLSNTVEADNQTVEDKYPEQGVVQDESKTVDQSVISETKVEALYYQALPLNETDTTTKEHHRDESFSYEDLSQQNEALNTNTLTKEDINDIIGVYNCKCKDTPFEVPPPRSFKKWRVKSQSSHLGFDIIVHASHKARKGKREMILEPIVEYQAELGACKQSEGKLRALALSLMLRQSAALMNVRVAFDKGSVIVVEKMTTAEFIARHGDKRSEVSGTLHAALNQLRFLKPGQYVLSHKAIHGENAMLYSARGAGGAGDAGGAGAGVLSLRGAAPPSDAQEALAAKAPPALDAALLPYHKSKSILPLAFTFNKNQVKEDKKMAAALAKAKLPPPALQWHKKKKKKKKKPHKPPAETSPT